MQCGFGKSTLSALAALFALMLLAAIAPSAQAEIGAAIKVGAPRGAAIVVAPSGANAAALAACNSATGGGCRNTTKTGTCRGIRVDRHSVTSAGESSEAAVRFGFSCSGRSSCSIIVACDDGNNRTLTIPVLPCPAGQERVGGTCQPSQAFCNNNNQILLNGSCQSCSGNTPIRNGNVCQPSQAVCNANNQIFVNGSCQSCSGNTPIRSGNVCQPSQAVCNANNQIFVNGSCQSCSGNTPIRSGNVCQPSQAVCNNNNQIFVNGSCQSCSGNTPIRSGNVCQPSQAVCNNNNQIFVNGSCQSCSGNTPIRSGNVCQPSQAVCNANNQIFVNGSCQSCPVGEERSGNTCAPSSGGGGAATAIVGGVVVVWLLYASSRGALDTETIPIAAYTNNSGTWQYEVGARQQWTQDNWLSYIQATRAQTSDSNEVFSYSSGLEYSNDSWQASFTTKSGQEKGSVNEFLLSANQDFGAWSVSSFYQVRYEEARTENYWKRDWTHDLKLGGIWQVSKWTVRPSVSFIGSSFSEMRDNREVRILMQWDF